MTTTVPTFDDVLRRLRTRRGNEILTGSDNGVVRNENSDTWGFSWLKEATQSSGMSLLASLMTDSTHNNPYAVELMREAFDIHPFESSFLRSGGLLRTGGDYLALREAQNMAWCERKTKEAIGKAGQGEHGEAIHLCTQALNLVHDYPFARVARGCSLAHITKYDDAIRDFRIVLSLNVNEHAAAYLAHTIDLRDRARQSDNKALPAYLLVAEDDVHREESSDGGNFDDEDGCDAPTGGGKRKKRISEKKKKRK